MGEKELDPTSQRASEHFNLNCGGENGTQKEAKNRTRSKKLSRDDPELLYSYSPRYSYFT